MRIAITAKESGRNAAFDPTFGRCGYFALYDAEEGYLGSYENESAKQSAGAGTAAARFVNGLKAGAIITGHLGPNASMAVKQLGLDVYLGSFSDAEEAYAKYRANEITKANL